MRYYILSTLLFLLLYISACTVQQPVLSTLQGNEAPFEIIIEADTSMPFLPPLHSFGFAKHKGRWIMIAGRTSGMHDFDTTNEQYYQDNTMPVENFNDNIFVCTDEGCKKMDISPIPKPYRLMFKSTNPQYFQDGKYFYFNGGYGQDEAIDNQDDTLSRWDTYNTIAKIDLDKLIDAVESGDQQKLVDAMKFGQSPFVESTGGELYKVDDLFYMVGGHIFNGTFQGGSRTFSQRYLNCIYRFKIEETATGLTVMLKDSITDKQPDNLTQFRRRDLPVVSTVAWRNGQLEENLTMYAGVFTSDSNKIEGLRSGSIFTNPIYLYQDGTYKLDTSYEQYYNIYTCAHFVAYDARRQSLHTTLIGGIQDGKLDTMSSYTNNIVTVNHSLRGGKTTQTQQGDIVNTTFLYGTEAHFVPLKGRRVKKMKKNKEIFDISHLSSGEEVKIGLFYGGIVKNKTANTTLSTNKVFSVTLRMK